MTRENKRAEATFGAGCFWGVEATFRQTAGVVATAVGYLGGMMDNPTYEDVCGGMTGHAEVVRIVFDPRQVTYEQLLDVFWDSHDPTTLNRQGPDVGTQYRSAIYYHTDEQAEIARSSLARANESGKFKSPIVTEITEVQTFWMAEDYHQQYLQKRGMSSCHI